jgi:predicted ArsR family transcriptional regulator
VWGELLHFLRRCGPGATIFQIAEEMKRLGIRPQAARQTLDELVRQKAIETGYVLFYSLPKKRSEVHS